MSTSVAGPGGPGGPGDALAALRDGRIQGGEERLRAASQLLEGIFYQQLFTAMRATIPEGGALSGGQGEEMFEGLLDERMSEAAAMRSEGGIGEALFRHFQQHVLVQGDQAADTRNTGPLRAEEAPQMRMAKATDATGRS